GPAHPACRGRTQGQTDGGRPGYRKAPRCRSPPARDPNKPNHPSRRPAPATLSVRCPPGGPPAPRGAFAGTGSSRGRELRSARAMDAGPSPVTSVLRLVTARPRVWRDWPGSKVDGSCGSSQTTTGTRESNPPELLLQVGPGEDQRRRPAVRAVVRIGDEM